MTTVQTNRVSITAALKTTLEATAKLRELSYRPPRDLLAFIAESESQFKAIDLDSVKTEKDLIQGEYDLLKEMG